MRRSHSTAAKLDFSLILPCYNESQHIEGSIKRIAEVLDNTRYDYEILLIDDKSQDNTVELIKKLAAKYQNIRTFFHEKNFGRGGTVQDGILKARANIVGFIDIDLEVAPDYIPCFVRTLLDNQQDVVIAQRIEPFNIFPFSLLIRFVLSRGYVYLIKFLLNIPFDDTEAGYKFFNKEKILPLLNQMEDKHWFWDTEVIARSLMAGFRIKEIPVLFMKRNDKDSTVRIIPDIIAYLKAINKFRKSLLAPKK